MKSQRIMGGNDTTLRVLGTSPVDFTILAVDLGGKDLLISLGLPFSVGGWSVAAGVVHGYPCLSLCKRLLRC
jgi:hypothetical protein